jgi:hypothetical protein
MLNLAHIEHFFNFPAVIAANNLHKKRAVTEFSATALCAV